MAELVWIELVAYERVVARGTERVTWWVHSGELWLPVKQHPEAIFEARSPGPQTIWETSARLPVELGTWLMRASKTPLPSAARDPLYYLDREALSARIKHGQMHFRVGPRGKLLRARPGEPPPPFERLNEE